MVNLSHIAAITFSDHELRTIKFLISSRRLEGGLEAERLPDGLLMLTCWSETERTNLMLFVVERLESVEQVADLHARCVTHRSAKEARDVQNYVSIGETEAHARELVVGYPYWMGLAAPDPVRKPIRDAYYNAAEDRNAVPDWELHLFVIHAP